MFQDITMVLKKIIDELNLTVRSGNERLNQEVTICISSDILSDVMARACKGSLWITTQTHQNVVAIVYFRGLAGVLLPDGLELDIDALEKAKDKSIPVLTTEMTTFDIIGRMYTLGIRGR